MRQRAPEGWEEVQGASEWESRRRSETERRRLLEQKTHHHQFRSNKWWQQNYIKASPQCYWWTTQSHAMYILPVMTCLIRKAKRKCQSVRARLYTIDSVLSNNKKSLHFYSLNNLSINLKVARKQKGIQAEMSKPSQVPASPLLYKSNWCLCFIENFMLWICFWSFKLLEKMTCRLSPRICILYWKLCIKH